MRHFKKLTKLAKKLRSDTGCPWDRSRKLDDMAKYLEEECDEAIAAIHKKDYENLKEELGDLLFSIVLTIQIAEEEKLFDAKGVLEDIAKKIISRHTWVFGKDKARTPEEALEMWKRNKERNKEAKK